VLRGLGAGQRDANPEGSPGGRDREGQADQRGQGQGHPLPVVQHEDESGRERQYRQGETGHTGRAGTDQSVPGAQQGHGDESEQDQAGRKAVEHEVDREHHSHQGEDERRGSGDPVSRPDVVAGGGRIADLACAGHGRTLDQQGETAGR